MARQSLPRTGFRVDPEIGWLRCLSVAASHGFQTFRPARRNRSNPPKKIVERIGCELRNRFGTSDPSPSGDARGNVVPRRWPTSGQGAACFGDPSPQQQGALRAAPQTTGKQPFRPESQTDARHKPNVLRNALASDCYTLTQQTNHSRPTTTNSFPLRTDFRTGWLSHQPYGQQRHIHCKPSHRNERVQTHHRLPRDLHGRLRKIQRLMTEAVRITPGR